MSVDAIQLQIKAESARKMIKFIRKEFWPKGRILAHQANLEWDLVERSTITSKAA